MLLHQEQIPTHDDHNSHEQLLQQEWEKSQSNEIILGLKENRPLEELLKSLPGFTKAFEERLDCLDCSDGRVCSGHKMALAGQGILLGTEDKAILEAKLKEMDIRVTAHDNCGAAGIAFPGPDSDLKGYEYTKALSAETGRPYGEVHKESFRCPVHNERALVLEGTGRFDVANLDGFPGQFISSASFFGLSAEYQKTEAKALINIALGDHGFGRERFSAENPFYLLVSAPDQAGLDKTMAIANEVAAEFDGVVKVDGFVAPARQE